MLDNNLMLLDATSLVGAGDAVKRFGAWVNFETVGGGVAPAPADASQQVRSLSWLLVANGSADADFEGTEAFLFGVQTSKDGVVVENEYVFESFLESATPRIERITIQSSGPYFRWTLVPVAGWIADETIIVSLGPTDGGDYAEF